MKINRPRTPKPPGASTETSSGSSAGSNSKEGALGGDGSESSEVRKARSSLLGQVQGNVGVVAELVRGQLSAAERARLGALEAPGRVGEGRLLEVVHTAPKGQSVSTQGASGLARSEPTALYLTGITLNRNFEGLFSNRNEIYGAALVYDLSGKAPRVIPIPDRSQVPDLSHSMRPGDTLKFLGDGLQLWPQQSVEGGLNVQLFLMESDTDARTVGDKLGKVADAVAESDLANLLGLIGGIASGGKLTAIEKAGEAVARTVQGLLQTNGDDPVAVFQGTYGAESLPSEAKSERYDQSGASVDLSIRPVGAKALPNPPGQTLGARTPLGAKSLANLTAKLHSAAHGAGQVLDLESAEGLVASRKVISRLPKSPIPGPKVTYVPQRAEVDAVGITHVQLRQNVEGARVFGEQVLAQIHPNGSVTFNGSTPASLEAVPPFPSVRECDRNEASAAAMEMAKGRYGVGGEMSHEHVERVLIRGDEGRLRPAFHVEMADFSASGVVGDPGRTGPVAPHFIVDGESGEVIRHWNALDRRHFPDAHHGGPGVAAPKVAAQQSADVNLPFGAQSASLELPFARNLVVETATLRLGDAANPGIEHDWRGDVQIRVTSPSGETVELTPHDANDSADDVSGDFDLSAAFAGERSAGTWKVELLDRFPSEDDGVVRKVELVLDGAEVEAVPDPDPVDPAAPVGDDFAPFVGQVSLDTTQTAAGYVLKTQDGRVETRDAQRRDPNLVAGRFEFSVPFTNPTDTWGGPGTSTAKVAAIETHHAATTFDSFLSEVFGMNSYDNAGSPLRAMANVGVGYNNAFWFEGLFHVGNGDGQTFDRLSTLDIIAHEIAHGVTEASAGLIYDRESGGLNESFSDVFGTMFEWWSTLQPGAADAGVLPFDWDIGEDARPAGDPLRSMANPTSDGFSIDHYADYRSSMDVHQTSGIQNKAFYLAVAGGTGSRGDQVSGLREVFGDADSAMAAAGQIFMRALRFYLNPSSSFADARSATLRAARDLYPNAPAVEQSIAQAWTAVGLRSAGAIA